MSLHRDLISELFAHLHNFLTVTQNIVMQKYILQDSSLAFRFILMPNIDHSSEYFHDYVETFSICFFFAVLQV